MGKSAKGEQPVTEYLMSMHVGLGVPVDAILAISVGEKIAWQGNVTAEGQFRINNRNLFGGIKKEGGVAGNVYFLPGGPDQVMPEALAKRLRLTSATCPGFRGISSLFFIGDPASGSTWFPFPGTTDGTGSGGGTETGWTPHGGGSNCVAPWTAILLANATQDGPGATVRADELRVGDLVWTQHERTLAWMAAAVEAVSRAPDERRWTVTFGDGREIAATPNHRLFAGGWKRLQDLKPGDVVKGVSDSAVLQVAPLDCGDVMKISVGEARTYVSAGLLSHNVKPDEIE